MILREMVAHEPYKEERDIDDDENDSDEEEKEDKDLIAKR